MPMAVERSLSIIKPDAVAGDPIGASHPRRAAPGTLRAGGPRSPQEHAVHGPRAPGTAARQIACSFRPEEIFPPHG